MKKTAVPSTNVEDKRVTPLQSRMGATTRDYQAAQKSERQGGFADSVSSDRFNSQMFGQTYKTGKIRQALTAAGKPAYKETSLNAQMGQIKDMLAKGGFK